MIAAKGGRLIGWKEARQYARLSLNFVRIFKFYVTKNNLMMNSNKYKSKALHRLCFNIACCR